jgi:putative nucleotidyltransferase with HDIG domain
MRIATRVYVSLIVALAAVGLAILYGYAPSTQPDAWMAVVVLVTLAIAADMLSFVLPQSAHGSIAFIPYFALAVINPSWTTVAVIAAVRVITEFAARREWTKGLFNVGQQTLAVTATIGVYRLVGGQSLLAIPELMSLSHVTRQAGGAALAAFASGLILNNVLVVGVIALQSGKSIWRVWFQNTGAMIVMDLITAPLVLFFAWVYAAFGWIAAATLWVPILGLRQVHKTNIELERTNEELLQLMVKSLEARDPYTSGHSRRVQHYSAIIARAVGLSERDVQQVGQAALLHDVGKIHEKYAPVLAKTDKLTPEEWALIQEHPVDGANLVATMTRLRGTVPSIRHHHENWDGTGYPDGLAGELIPEAARIIRFADTIDAMTTERPYRAPLTEAQVRAEIVRCRGSQFDPAIADKLLSSPLWRLLFASSSIGEPFSAPRLSVVATVPEDRRARVAARS